MPVKKMKTDSLVPELLFDVRCDSIRVQVDADMFQVVSY